MAMIPNDSKTGELWGELPGGGAEHIGTIYLDTYEFEEAPEDGIQGYRFKIPSVSGAKIVIRGKWKFTSDHFDDFRKRWLAQKFPTLYWN